MKRTFFIGLITFCFLSTIVFADETYTISGDVIFKSQGDIYVCLVTKEGFKNFQVKGFELSAPYCKHIKTTPNKNGQVSFTFENVLKGAYSIIAYQDFNGNQEVDRQDFGYYITVGKL